MTVQLAAAVIATAALLCGILGGLMGFMIGTLTPGYYAIVFRIPVEQSVHFPQLGMVLGLTQGVAIGSLLGFGVCALIAWYDVQKLRQGSRSVPDTDA